MQFDWKAFTTLDRVIAGGGFVAFVAAFLPWYGASVGPFSVTVSGWSAGFSAWSGALLLTAAGVLVVLGHSGTSLTRGSLDPPKLVAIVAAVGLLLVVVRWLSFPQYHAGGGLSYDVGARYGIFLALIAGLAQVTAAVMAMRAAGEHVPVAPAPAGSEPAAPEPPPEVPAAPEE